MSTWWTVQFVITAVILEDCESVGLILVVKPLCIHIFGGINTIFNMIEYDIFSPSSIQIFQIKRKHNFPFLLRLVYYSTACGVGA